MRPTIRKVIGIFPLLTMAPVNSDKKTIGGPSRKILTSIETPGEQAVG